MIINYGKLIIAFKIPALISQTVFIEFICLKFWDDGFIFIFLFNLFFNFLSWLKVYFLGHLQSSSFFLIFFTSPLFFPPSCFLFFSILSFYIFPSFTVHSLFGSVNNQRNATRDIQQKHSCRI